MNWWLCSFVIGETETDSPPLYAIIAFGSTVHLFKNMIVDCICPLCMFHSNDGDVDGMVVPLTSCGVFRSPGPHDTHVLMAIAVFVGHIHSYSNGFSA